MESIMKAPVLQGMVHGKGSSISDNIPALVSPQEVILNVGAAKALKGMLKEQGLTIDEFNAMYAPAGAETKVKGGVLHAAGGTGAAEDELNVIPMGNNEQNKRINLGLPVRPLMDVAPPMPSPLPKYGVSTAVNDAVAPVIDAAKSTKSDISGGFDELGSAITGNQATSNPVADVVKIQSNKQPAQATIIGAGGLAKLNDAPTLKPMMPKNISNTSSPTTIQAPERFSNNGTPIYLNFNKNDNPVYSDVQGYAGNNPSIAKSSANQGLPAQEQQVMQQVPTLQQRQQRGFVPPQINSLIDPQTRQKINEQINRDLNASSKKIDDVTTGLNAKYANKRLDDFLGYDTRDRVQKLAENKTIQDESQFQQTATDKRNNDAWTQLMGKSEFDYKKLTGEQSADAEAAKSRLAQANTDREYLDKTYTRKTPQYDDAGKLITDVEGKPLIIEETSTPRQDMEKARQASKAEISKWQKVLQDPKLPPEKKQDILARIDFLSGK